MKKLFLIIVLAGAAASARAGYAEESTPPRPGAIQVVTGMAEPSDLLADFTQRFERAIRDWYAAEGYTQITGAWQIIIIEDTFPGRPLPDFAIGVSRPHGDVLAMVSAMRSFLKEERDLALLVSAAVFKTVRLMVFFSQSGRELEKKLEGSF